MSKKIDLKMEKKRLRDLWLERYSLPPPSSPSEKSLHENPDFNVKDFSKKNELHEKDYMNYVWNEIATRNESNNLSNDFLSALQKNLFTDVSIKCGDYVQQVHKFVLAARSPVFEAMFSTSMEESEKGIVTINDIDSSLLDDLLTFIYGAQVKNLTLSKACDLLYVAEKYQVKGLKSICICHLRSCLSFQTALQILQYADLYDETLKKDTLIYVCNNFAALKITEEWKTLQSQKPNLSIDVYSMVVEKYEKQTLGKICNQNNEIGQIPQCQLKLVDDSPFVDYLPC